MILFKNDSKIMSEQNHVRSCIERALSDVCEVCDIHESLVMSRSRQEDVTIARFFLYTLLRNAGFTWTHIGQICERDHGAVFAGYKRLGMRLECREKMLIMMRDSLASRGWVFREYVQED